MNQKSAITVEAEALDVVTQFGDAVSAVFEQMLKGNWKDDHDHPVKNNTAMISLKMPMMNALSLRARVEAAPAAPAVPAEPPAAVIDRMCEFDVIRNRRPHDRELAKLIYRAIIEQQAAPAAPAAPTPAGRTFSITINYPGATPATDQYDLVGFCVSVVDAYGMTESEACAVVGLQVGEHFTNEDMTVRRVA